MNSFKSDEYNANKNCFLAFKSKKVNDFKGAEAVISDCASIGCYFDKSAFIAFDNSEEIVRAIKDGKENYENMVVYCPFEMGNTLKNFISSLYNSVFNDIGILDSGNSSVFIIYSDHENVLQTEDIKNKFECKYGVRYERIYFRTIGAPVSEINSALTNAKNLCPDLTFNISEKYGDCRIEISYRSDVLKSVTDAVKRTVMNDLNEYVYALEDISIEERLFDLLKLRKMKISVAESFTGGGVGKALVSLPGISEVFFEGLNTYSNDSKKLRLGVKDLTLGKYGAVSEQTAYEMAEGLLNIGRCDVCVATTGIAGPKSDSSSKPVGLVFISVGTQEKITVHKYNLKGDRDNITKTAINLALFLAYKTLK